MRYTLPVLILSIGATAQQPAEQSPLILKSTTRLVQVSVIATQKGSPAEGLKREDFTITDNGKPQQIALFSVDSSGALPAAAQPLPPGTFTNMLEQKSGAPSSITILLLDSMNTRFEDQAYAKQQIVRYLKTIQPDDRIGLYVLGGGLRILHDYTTDSKALLEKLASYRGENLPNLRASEPGASDTDTLQLDAWLNNRGGSMGAERDFYMANRVLGTLRSLQFIADHLARVPGRKNLIWVSGGFPLTLGFDNIAEFRDPARDQRTFNDEITQCVRAMNNANLAVYPVDAGGLMTDPRFSAASRFAPDLTVRSLAPSVQNQETMRELADRTGGRAYYNTNDLSKAIRDAVGDTKLTYTLGYYPSDDKLDGKFHKINIKVDRPGVSMRYRKGYFDLPEQPQNDAARKIELRDAVYSPLDASEIGLTVQLQPGDPAKPNTLTFIARIEPKGVSLQPLRDRWAGKIDILWVQKDDRGRQYNAQDDTLEMRLSQPNYQKLTREGLAYRRAVERAPRATQLRIVVRDAASGAVGSVTVPFSQLAQR